METNQSKMAALLAKQEELRTYINDYGIGDGNKLANEMQRLKMAVEAQNAELHDAALLQDAYHSEVRQLSRLVEDAQRKISSAPVVTSSLDQLKRQLAEHHVCARFSRCFQNKKKLRDTLKFGCFGRLSVSVQGTE